MATIADTRTVFVRECRRCGTTYRQHKRLRHRVPLTSPVEEAIQTLHRQAARIRPNELSDLLHTVVHVVETLAACAPSVIDAAKPDLGSSAAAMLDRLNDAAVEEMVAREERR